MASLISFFQTTTYNLTYSLLFTLKGTQRPLEVSFYFGLVSGQTVQSEDC